MKTTKRKTAAPKFYRQGDVLLRRIDEVPAGEPTLSIQVTLALGEATGHHHTLYAERGSIETWEPTTDRNRVFRVTTPVELRHQEHGLLRIEPGLYRQTIEREFDPFEQLMKRVVD